MFAQHRHRGVARIAFEESEFKGQGEPSKPWSIFLEFAQIAFSHDRQPLAVYSSFNKSELPPSQGTWLAQPLNGQGAGSAAGEASTSRFSMSDPTRPAVQWKVLMTTKGKVTELIAMMRENADSYRRAAQALVGEPDIAHFFEEMADNREMAADAIERKLIDSGKRPNRAILTAPLSEGWGRPASNETDPLAVIQACHQAEERALKAFEEALHILPEDWRWELNEYSQHIRSALAKMHAWPQHKEAGADFGQHGND
jgi:uncharacterized protein (TIGR02284 family)